MKEYHVQRSASATIADKLDHALQHQQRGELAQAESLYREILAEVPTHADAWYLLGLMQSASLRHADAITCFERVLALDPRHADALNKRGNALRGLGRPADALASYELALALQPNHVAALYNRGNVLAQLRRPTDALAAFDTLLALVPDDAEALCDRGNLLLAQQRFDDAITSYDRALSLQPDIVVACRNRGDALQALKRHEDAVASYDRALELRPDDAESLTNRGNALVRLGRPAEALADYELALAQKPDDPIRHYNRGSAMLALNRHDAARASFALAIALKPDFAEALNNQALALVELNRIPEALDACTRALAARPDHAEALLNRGAALSYMDRHEEAIKDFERALELNSDLAFASAMLLNSRAHCCSWDSCGEVAGRLIADVDSGACGAPPMTFLKVSDSALGQLRCAQRWCRDRYPPSTAPLWKGERYRHDRIRLAYVSADFREHAVAYAIAGLFEQHDKTRFELTGVALGAPTSDPMRVRVAAAFERFIDAAGKDDVEVANLLRALEVDIAVDLNGFSKGCRSGIFALRPAPLQVNYLGYPGTMGAEYMDYLIADRVVIPPEHQAYYAERVAYLPDTYMVTDSDRRSSDRVPRRGQVGLPEGGLVYCAFHNSYKITPQMLQIWLRLLRRTEGSTLWLRKSNETASDNLRRHAAQSGVAPERLVFAGQPASVADYLALYRLADILLDTAPYNAHSTACDALNAGLPVLTCLGGAFAGRVAASLLHAIGLPELITHSLDEYEALALNLATDATSLAGIKKKLARNRDRFPLFDTDGFRRHIESAYATMWQRFQRGEPPAAFDVERI